MRIVGWIFLLIFVFIFWHLGVWWESKVFLIDGQIFQNIIKLVFTLFIALLGLYMTLWIINKFDLFFNKSN